MIGRHPRYGSGSIVVAVRVVSVVSRISVSVGIVSVVSVTVGEEGWVVPDVERRRAFDVDHFPDGDFEMMHGYVRWLNVEGCALNKRMEGVPFLEACDCPQSVLQSLVENAR